MIIKIENGETTEFIDCHSVFKRPEVCEEGVKSSDVTWGLYITFSNRTTLTRPLFKGDCIWYLNENGKTVDKDFCGN